MRLSGLAAAGLSINPLQAVVVHNNSYVNRALGIMFEKPSDWTFVNVKDFGKLKEKQILGNGWENNSEDAWEILGEPICIITKYDPENPKYKNVFSPTITIDVDHKSEYEDYEISEFEDYIRLCDEGQGHIFLKEGKLLNKNKRLVINNTDFYEQNFEYIFEHKELEDPLKVEGIILRAEHSNFYYEFNFHESQEADQIAMNEYEIFKKSIQFI